uniref:hypothetical protein n=1 Tax=Bacillus multifaciens TaxID=3068506 RepID=UPI003F49616B
MLSLGIQEIIEQVKVDGEYLTSSFEKVKKVLQEAKKQGLSFDYRHSDDNYFYQIYSDDL